MNDGQDDGEAPFSGLLPPAPPAALRERVLQKAREALAREGARDVWTRIWENRFLRVTWAAATLLLVFAHLVITVRPPAHGGRASAPVAAPAPDSAAELAAVAGLSRLDEDLLPRLEVSATAPAAGPGPAPSKPADRNRKESAS